MGLKESVDGSRVVSALERIAKAMEKQNGLCAKQVELTERIAEGNEAFQRHVRERDARADLGAVSFGNLLADVHTKVESLYGRDEITSDSTEAR